MSRGAGEIHAAVPHAVGCLPPRFHGGARAIHDRRERENLAERFFDAFKDGDVDRLRELLAADVQMVGDSGGKAPQMGKGIFGSENVARVLAAIVPPFVRHAASRE